MGLEWDHRYRVSCFVLIASLLLSHGAGHAAEKKDKKKADKTADPYKEMVWPPPPDEARIKLEAVLRGRVDLEGESKIARALFGLEPKKPWDDLKRPFGVEIDSHGRILVTDSETGGLLRFDLENRRFDVLGAKTSVPLKQPFGLGLGPDGVIYVADIGRKQIVALDEEGVLKAVFGSPGELTNPTDVAVSPDGKRLFVADSKAHRIVVYDIQSGERKSAFGKVGQGRGELFFPTSLGFSPDGLLFIVNQMNSRVEVVNEEGEFVDQLGALGVGFGQFVRPKDIAFDESGLIFVSDTALNNFQVFDADFTLLTFVGEGGESPGRFLGLSGIAVRGDRLAAVDQLGKRLQVFRLLASKTAE